ncbi:MAG: glycosyltransferase family 4 protein [Alphaproteobacteria bacterium]|nr:glycosyltransferase family 4 protein [Alphaproteobacteria bacterium]
MAAPVAFILKGYPRLSETFIAQEIRALEQRGLDIRIFSMRHPTDRAVHPVHLEITAPVSYLPEYLHDAPLRVWRAWRAMRRRPGYRAARKIFLADLRRDPTPNRIRRFGQALVLAHELPQEIGALHAHFLHTPASVARYAAILTGLPWTCSAHAKDIWTTPEWEKREKLAAMAWLVTCTDAGRAHLAALAPSHEKVELVYHGLDLARFASATTPRATATPMILSVGRAVEKKGFDDLLAALAALPPALGWRFIHVGGGPLLPALKRQATQSGIAAHIEWRGALPQDEVLRLYREADLFVLPSRVAGDGDRDGLPNVLMEAQSQGVACISTDVSGIPELILDRETGVLVPPHDPSALARAIETLLADPDARARLGAAGQARVIEKFSHAVGIDVLAAKFGMSCASPSTRR